MRLSFKVSTIFILYLIYGSNLKGFSFLPFSFAIYDSVFFVNGPILCVFGCFGVEVNKANGKVWISLVDFFAVGFGFVVLDVVVLVVSVFVVVVGSSVVLNVVISVVVVGSFVLVVVIFVVVVVGFVIVVSGMYTYEVQ